RREPERGELHVRQRGPVRAAWHAVDHADAGEAEPPVAEAERAVARPVGRGRAIDAGFLAVSVGVGAAIGRPTAVAGCIEQLAAAAGDRPGTIGDAADRAGETDATGLAAG